MSDPKDIHLADPTSIGNLAMAWHELTEEDIRRGAEHQVAHPDLFFGECLVACGVLSSNALAHLLRKQADLRASRARPEDLAKVLNFAKNRSSALTARIGDMLKRSR